MTEQIVPILRVADAETAVGWYARLGFTREFEHRFAPGMPLYVGLRRQEVRLHLSEHLGDAPRGGVVYFWVDDIDAVAAEFDIAPEQAPWAREVELTDPDGNRIRAGQSTSPPDSD